MAGTSRAAWVLLAVLLATAFAVCGCSHVDGGAAPEAIAVDSPATTPWRLSGVCRERPERRGEVGKPVPRARVTVWAHQSWTRWCVASVVADDRGRYEVSLESLKRLSPARRTRSFLDVRARKGSWLGSTDASMLPADEARPLYWPSIDVALERSASISGRVLGPAGEPVASAVIEMTDDPGMRHVYPNHPVDTRDGRFTLPWDETGRQRIRLRADGIGVSPFIAIDVKPYEQVHIGDVTLRPAGTIAGVARYPDGTPARHLSLAILCPEHQGAIFPVKTLDGYEEMVRTDEAGRFRAVALDRAEFVVSCDESDDYPTMAVPLGTLDVHYRVPGPRVLIRARDERGRPVPGIFVQVMRWRGEAVAEARRRASGAAPLHELARTAVDYTWEMIEAPDGVLGLPTRAGEFWVVEICHAGVEHATQIAEIRPGVLETWIDLPVRTARQLGRFVITTPVTPMLPPESFHVWISTAHTDAFVRDCWGSFAPGEPLPGLPPGRYRVGVRPEGDRVARPIKRTIELRPGDNEISVPIRLASELRVRVAVPPRTDYTALRRSLAVRVIALNAERVEATLDGFDRGDVDAVPRSERREVGRIFGPVQRDVLLDPSRYRLEASADGVATVETIVTLEPGKKLEATLRLK